MEKEQKQLDTLYSGQVLVANKKFEYYLVQTSAENNYIFKLIMMQMNPTLIFSSIIELQVEEDIIIRVDNSRYHNLPHSLHAHKLTQDGKIIDTDKNYNDMRSYIEKVLVTWAIWHVNKYGW